MEVHCEKIIPAITGRKLGQSVEQNAGLVLHFNFWSRVVRKLVCVKCLN